LLREIKEEAKFLSSRYEALPRNEVKVLGYARLGLTNPSRRICQSGGSSRIIGEKMLAEKKEEYKATKNACKLCTPLGASLAFKGIQRAVPLLHGSQGCSTYIRRYLISHFKEPVDIACSNFGEETAIFGGGANLKIALENIRKQYHPDLIGVATTCLSETIGDDVPMFIREYREMNKKNLEGLPNIVHVSTPSYKGTHIDGFHAAIRGTADLLASSHTETEKQDDFINIFPGMLSPADIRHLKEILTDFNLGFVMLPDYSQTLDGALWSEYQKIPAGGTKVDDIMKMGNATASLEFGRILAEEKSAAKLLNTRHNVPYYPVGIPVGINETDIFFSAIEAVTGKQMPEKYAEERGRLIDSYTDGHKYVMEKRAVVYGEEDLVVGIVSFLSEIGILPVLCASGGTSGHLRKKIKEVISSSHIRDREEDIMILDNSDFTDIETAAKELKPDIFIGSSKGYSVARKLNVPIVRVGFPIHDRVGGSRILHVGYRGAQQLFDRIANTLLERSQDMSDIGYSYM